MEFNSEQGIEYIRALLNNSVTISAIISIGHQSFPRAEELLLERTGGKYIKPSFSKILANTRIPTYFVSDVNSEECMNTIVNLDLDILVTQCSKIIRIPIYDIPSHGSLNCHTAILPYLRGCSCLEWSIYHNYPIGATCHFMVKKVDSGPIISQSLLQYDQGDPYEIIRTKMIYLMANLMCNSVEKIISGEISKHGDEPNLDGPWFSPMRDPNTINLVKNKLLGTSTSPEYCPVPFPNQKDLETTTIHLP